MTKQTYVNVTADGTPIENIISMQVSEGYKQATSRCSFELEDTSDIDLNDFIVVDIGYADDHEIIFKGYVDEISYTRMSGTYSVESRDILKLAIEHYIVSLDLQNPWSRTNIPAEDLVRDLLLEAGITNYSGDATGFTFGVQHPAEFNLMAVWDAIRTVCNILAYNCYAENETVYFKRVLPVPSGEPIHTFTVGNTGDIILIHYGYNTDNLRNKVVVFGKEPIAASASRPDSYDPRYDEYRQLLPEDFYKTAIVSSELIDTQGMASDSAQYNLDLYNRLTEYMRLETEGIPGLHIMDTVAITEPYTEMVAAAWFVYSIEHKLDDSGYRMTVNLTR